MSKTLPDTDDLTQRLIQARKRQTDAVSRYLNLFGKTPPNERTEWPLAVAVSTPDTRVALFRDGITVGEADRVPRGWRVVWLLDTDALGEIESWLQEIQKEG